MGRRGEAEGAQFTMWRWFPVLAAAVLSGAATADGGSPGNGTSPSPAAQAPAAQAAQAAATEAPPRSVEVMLSKAENDPNLKYCTMDGLFCIPRNYSK